MKLRSLFKPHCYVESEGFVKIEQSAVAGSRGALLKFRCLCWLCSRAADRERDLPQAGFHTSEQLNHALALKF